MNTIKKNFFYNAVYQLLIIILPIVTAPYVSRVLGPTNMGEYSYTYSVATYFLLLAKLGFDNYGNRSIATNRHDADKLNKTFSGIYILQMVIATFSIVLYIVYTFVFSENFFVSLIQGLWVVSALFDINWFFYGLEEFSLVVIRNTIVKLISVIMIFLIVKQPQDMWKYALILSGGAIVGFLITWPFVFSKVSIVKVSLKEVFSHLHQASILFIPVIAISVFTVLDKIMLGYMGSFSQVGYFDAADKVMMAPKGIIGALGTVMLPRMASEYAKKDNKNRELFINASLSFALVFSIGCMFGIIGISKTFVPIFFGVKYLPTIFILALMAVVLPFYAVGNVVRTQMLIPNMKDKPYIISVIWGAIVNVILNVLLIPYFGANGTVVATLAAEIAIAVIQFWAVRLELNLKKFKSTIFLSFISSGCMIIGIVFVTNILSFSFISLILQITVGVVIFIIVFVIFALRSKDEMIRILVKSILKM